MEDDLLFYDEQEAKRFLDWAFNAGDDYMTGWDKHRQTKAKECLIRLGIEYTPVHICPRYYCPECKTYEV